MGGSGYWRTSGGDEETGAKPTPPHAGQQDEPAGDTDQPSETGASAGRSGKHEWLNIDNESDEQIASFLGLDRTDQLPDDLDAWTPPGRRSTDRGAESADEPSDGVRPSAEQLDGARTWLAENHPSPYDNPGKGLKTWGVWWDDQGGSGVEVSLDDERSLIAEQRLTELGLPAKSELRHHVETKLAAAMAQTDVQHVAVVINHQVCQGPLSCATWLPKIIKEGGTVRVYQHDGTEYPLFRGEA